MKHNNHGFSLIETVVAMAILGAFTVSICTCLVLSLRMNEKTSTLMQEQMAVSSAVETLMATGIAEAKDNYIIDIDNNGIHDCPTVTINTAAVDPLANYYKVTVRSKNVDGTPGNITIETQIRKAGGT